jgi:aspartyl/asparaginyl beta-hydroxylase (cupin superfamily)
MIYLTPISIAKLLASIFSIQLAVGLVQILAVVGWILLGLALILLLMRLFAPGLLALPYSLFLSLFVKNPPYVNMEKYFPHHKLLQDNWQAIRDEAVQLLEIKESIPTIEQIDPMQRHFSARDQIPWRTYMMKAMGNWIPPNCEKAPVTTGLLREMPEVVTALFSILEGGKHLPGHFGFFRGILRYHLGLVVPMDNPPYLLVKNQKYHWKEGEDVLFDDTYWHEAKNPSDQIRIVLFVDVLRTDTLPAFLRKINLRMFEFFSGIKRVKVAAKRAEVKVA